MAFVETRESYVKEFIEQLISQLFPSVEKKVEDQDEDQLQQVLEAVHLQSLVDLETRFRNYCTKLGPERDAQKIRNIIQRSEKRLNNKLYQENKNQNRKSEIRHIHREALKNCYSLLIRDLDLFESSLMDDLLATDVVSVSDKDSIRGGGTRKRQNEEFYSYLVGRLTFDEFHKVFLPALNKDHKHLADALISEQDRLEDEYQESQCVACRTRRHIQLKRLATPLLLGKVIDLPLFTDLRSQVLSNSSKWAELRHAASDADIIAALEKKYPDFHREFLQQDLKSLDCRCPAQDVAESTDVVPFARLMSEQDSVSGHETFYSGVSELEEANDVAEVLSFQTEDLEQDYKMTANPRGICLIINNFRFPDSHHDERHGSEFDVMKLSATFKRLQFEVVCATDLTADRMKQMLQEHASMDHSKYDAFVCAISTNGDQEGLICPGRGRVTVPELTSLFKATRCPTLAGKPKIFFIQTSRGESFMDGLNLDESKDIVADESDFLIGYSAVEGYASYRNVKTGSHFITALTHVLDNQADQHDLLECLTLTNREVSRLNMMNRQGMKKQVPAPIFTLTKKVHFTSDPLWPYATGTD